MAQRHFIKSILHRTTLLVAAAVALSFPLAALALKTKCSLALTMAHGLTEQIRWDLWEVKNQEVRISKYDSRGRFLSLNNATYTIELEQGLHFSTASYYAQRVDSSKRGDKSEPDASLVTWARARFRSAMTKAMDFVIPTYKIRRPKWVKNFLNKLSDMPDVYELQSTYINIENKPWPKGDARPEDWASDPELIATIRLITEKEGAVPLEGYLGIKVLADGKLKVEPGNFVIAREANDVAWIEIAIQLIAQIHRLNRDSRKEPLFVTYADEYSEHLYKNLGFEFCHPSQLTAAPGVLLKGEDGHLRVAKDEITWAPMYATEEMLVNAMYAKLEKVASKQSNEYLVSHLREAVKQTDKALKKADETLGRDRQHMIWEVQGEQEIGMKCPVQARRYDSVAFRTTGNGGYLCFACDYVGDDLTQLFVSYQSRCPLTIECVSGSCH